MEQHQDDDTSMATLLSPEESRESQQYDKDSSSNRYVQGVVNASTTSKHPTAVAMSAVLVCPPHEAEAAREMVQEALLEATPFDQAMAFALCGEVAASQNGTTTLGPSVSGRNRGRKNTMSQHFTNKEEILKWGPPRFFVPHRVGVAGSAKPLIASETLMKFVHSKYYTPFSVVLVCLATLFLILGSFGIATGSAYWPTQFGAVLSFLLCFGTNLASYSRTISRQIAMSFEFLYLMSQVVAATGAISYWQYIRRGEFVALYIPFQFLAYIVSGACLFLMDASRTTRVQKGLIMTISALGMALYAFLWNRDSTPTAEQVIDLYIFKTMIKTLVSTPLAVCSFFALKYAASSLFLKHDAMMLKFAPRIVKLSELELVSAAEASGADGPKNPQSRDNSSTTTSSSSPLQQYAHAGASAYSPDEGMTNELSESAAAAKQRRRTNTLIRGQRERRNSSFRSNGASQTAFTQSEGAKVKDADIASKTSNNSFSGGGTTLGLSTSQEPEELKLRYRNRGQSLKISRHYSAAKSASTLEDEQQQLSSSQQQLESRPTPRSMDFTDEV